jgi:hypothetical protein
MNGNRQGAPKSTRIAHIAYRISVVALLALIAFLVHREGERIASSQWAPSEPLGVTVENSSDDPLPVAIQSTDENYTPIPSPLTPGANGLTPDEQARLNKLYPSQGTQNH